MVSLAGTGGIPAVVSSDAAALASPARLAALRQVGLGPTADEGMERLARLVASTLRRPSPHAVTVGDITGHDMRAATIMGQVRSMLRQADLDHQILGPAAAVTAVEDACHALRLDATGTVVHAHLHPLGTGDGWQLTWTNAGHPPPVLVHPDGQTEILTEHEMLLWPGMTDGQRIDRRRILAPGTTLLLYTDGLIEQRGADSSAAIDHAAAVLGAAPAGQPLEELLQVILGEVAGPSAHDDIALLAVQVPAG